MEWVETTGSTLEEAKEAALDQLGVAEDDAEFEIVDEPKAGLFGRTRGEARVRARVRPATPRGKTERRPRKQAAEKSSEPREQRPRKENAERGERRERAPREDRPQREPREPREKIEVDPEEVGKAAAEFLNGLVTAFGTTGSVKVSRIEEEIEVLVDGSELGLMVGPGGATLLAIQDLTRVASQRRLGDQDTRLRIDIAGYRERRREVRRGGLSRVRITRGHGHPRATPPKKRRDVNRVRTPRFRPLQMAGRPPESARF